MAKKGTSVIDISGLSGMIIALCDLHVIAKEWEMGMPDSDKTELPAKEQVLWLKAHLAFLTPKDQGFAGSLCDYFLKYNTLSPKQIPWFWTMHDRAAAGYSHAANESVTGVQAQTVAAVSPQVMVTPKVDVGDFHGVINLFIKAKEHLKYPKITLQLTMGMGTQESPEQKKTLVLYHAGANSKHPGTVQINNGKKFGEYQYQYYGYVEPDGVWKPNPKLSLNIAEQVQKLLSSLAKDPVAVASAHGKMTGRCCFCNKHLTDEKSVAAGYGPVCAEHFGLSAHYKSGLGFFDALKDVKPFVFNLGGKPPNFQSLHKPWKAADVGVDLAWKKDEAAAFAIGKIVKVDHYINTVMVEFQSPADSAGKGKYLSVSYTMDVLLQMGFTSSELKEGSTLTFNHYIAESLNELFNEIPASGDVDEMGNPIKEVLHPAFISPVLPSVVDITTSGVGGHPMAYNIGEVEKVLQAIGGSATKGKAAVDTLKVSLEKPKKRILF
jgi:hypothetical protein